MQKYPLAVGFSDAGGDIEMQLMIETDAIPEESYVWIGFTFMTILFLLLYTSYISY